MSSHPLTEKKSHPWQNTIQKLENERYSYNAENNLNRLGIQQAPFASVTTSSSMRQAQPRSAWGESARVVDYGRSSRRRPRIGIFPSSSPTGAASSNDNESNLDSLELALQDTSKTSSSTTSTDSNSRSPRRINPQTPNSLESFEDELYYIHRRGESHQTRNPNYARRPKQPPNRTWPSALSPNPFVPTPSPSSPFANRKQSPSSTSTFAFSSASSRSSSNPFSDMTGRNSEPNNPYLRLTSIQSAQAYAHASSVDDTSNYQYSLNAEDGSQQSRDNNTNYRCETGRSSEEERNQKRLALHRLCEEATSPTDMAWRNALYLLGMQPDLAKEVDTQGRAALHVACTGHATVNDPPFPPPPYIIQAFLIANPAAIQQTDSDCRLPIHCLAATSGDAESLQLLVEAHPASIVAQDAMGWTPLHLYLQNQHIHIAIPQIQTLLGMTLPLETSQDQHETIRQRRGDHLKLNVEHLDRMRRKTQRENSRWQPMERWNIKEEVLNSYPEDVQQCLVRLSLWERKQHRLEKKKQEANKQQQQENKDIAFQSTSSCKSYSYGEPERNPAVILAPQDRRLPLHMIILRGLLDVHLQSSRVEPVPEKTRRKSKSKSSSRTQPKQQQHTLIVIVRMLIAAYPESLITRDSNGHTPLLLAMVVASDVLPSQELLEILLGKRTAGYDSLPSWAHDVPYPIQHAYTPVSRQRLAPAAERYCNPAVVSSLDTCQLPLHIAAEEWGDHPSLLQSIYESYPGAIHVQDARGRMPLHILLSNYRRITPQPEIVAMLLTDKVARACNDEGQIPFDLLVDAAPVLPKDPLPCSKNLHPDPYSAFQHFFQPSILASAGTAGNRRTDGNFLRRRAEADVFLWRLRSLPPWIRRQACSSPFVQELLMEEVSSPANCAFVIIQGITLLLILITFHRQTVLFLQTAENNDLVPTLGSNASFFSGTEEELVNLVFAEPSLRYQAWNTLAIYGLSAVGIGYQTVFWALSASLNEFQHLCLFNIWRWVDLISISAVVATSVLIHEGISDEHVLVVTTVATGMLWCSIVGFISNWWYGMAYFTGSILKIIQLALWPALLASICVVAFAEMFYTMAKADCIRALGSTPICSLRDSYHLVYFLVVGEPVVDIGSPMSPSVGMTLLAVLFATLFFLLFLTVLFATMVVASNTDSEALALDTYWEPKLAFVVSSQSSRVAAARYNNGMWIPQASRLDKFESRLGDLWGVSMCLLFGIGKHHYWYATADLAPLQTLLWKAALIVFVPFWLLVGLLTAGLLWPPQVRRFLFRPRLRSATKPNEGKEFLASQVAGMKNEVMNLKNMSYEQSHDIQQELHQLKAIIAANLND